MSEDGTTARTVTRDRVVMVAVLAALVAVLVGLSLRSGSTPASGAGGAAVPVTTAPVPATVPPTPSVTHRLHLTKEIDGDISPKSVAVSGKGLVFAQNMMYKHTVTVYDRDGVLLKTISDSVDLASFGVADHPGTSKGAPVEAAFSPNGKDAYVSNYSMYGAGFGPEGTDDCTPSSDFSPSFVYRVNLKALAVDAVVGVGSVPKYVAVTPDGRYVLVTNWCSYDLSVIDAKTNTEIKRIPIGPYPRGIAVDPSSRTAYVVVMGARDVATIDLTTFAVGTIGNVGSAPRHLVMDPAGQFLYVTLNADGRVAKVDLHTGAVVTSVATGQEPRSMAISSDGQSLYVVNYGSDTVTKLATADLSELQVEPTPSHPIGVAYDPLTNRVWVASYAGVILVYDDD